MPELAADLATSEEDRLLQAEAAVRSYCGWHIAPQRTDTYTIERAWGRTILLPTLHVEAVVSVTADDVLLEESTDYVWSTNGVVSLGVHDYSRGYRNVVIVFTHGYMTPPPEVTAAVQSMAQRAIDSPSGRTVLQVGTVRWGEGYSAHQKAERAALDRYKIPSRP